MSASVNRFTDAVKNIRLGKSIYGGTEAAKMSASVNRFTDAVKNVRLGKSIYGGGQKCPLGKSIYGGVG
jgi:hypothetical protein